MNWQKYNCNGTMAVRRGRGLSGMDMDAIKTSKTTVAEKQRQFGTELSNNIIVNQTFHRLAKKRTFKQFDEIELKEEENANRHYEHQWEGSRPAKRRRVLLNENGTESSKVVPVQTLKKQEGEMDEEDVDLESTDKQQPPSMGTGAPRRATNKHNVRRSQRLQNKKERRLQLGLEGQAVKVSAIRCRERVPVPVRPQLQIITEGDRDAMDCDAAKRGDDLFCPEYAGDICAWYRKVEESSFQRSLIRNNYISTRFQPDLNDSMRVILLNWLFNVHRRFQLKDRVIYLCVYILDSYLSLVPVRRDQLQLVGCSALWIASKYHEIYAPEVTDFVFISDHSFEVEDLHQTEVQILVQMEFKFADIMTPLHFLERFLQIAAHPLFKKYEARGTVKASKDGQRYVALVGQLSRFFAHLILFDCKVMSSSKPSLMAASALCFTVLSISLYTKWPEFLIEATGYDHHEMKPVMLRMDQLRADHIGDNKKGSVKTMSALKKVHKPIQKWLGRLNVNNSLNNGTEAT